MDAPPDWVNSTVSGSRTVELKGGRTQKLYFFAKEPGEGSLDAIPAGYQVAESKNGLPVLKKTA